MKRVHSHRILFVHKHSRRSIVLYKNMAPVTSCENDLLYPARDTLLHVIKYGGKWRDRRLEKHVLPVVVVVVFFFRE